MGSPNLLSFKTLQVITVSKLTCVNLSEDAPPRICRLSSSLRPQSLCSSSPSSCSCSCPPCSCGCCSQCCGPGSCCSPAARSDGSDGSHSRRCGRWAQLWVMWLVAPSLGCSVEAAPPLQQLLPRPQLSQLPLLQLLLPPRRSLAHVLTRSGSSSAAARTSTTSACARDSVRL